MKNIFLVNDEISFVGNIDVHCTRYMLYSLNDYNIYVTFLIENMIFFTIYKVNVYVYYYFNNFNVYTFLTYHDKLRPDHGMS